MKKHLTILTGASRGMGLAMAEQLLSPDTVLLCISRHANDALAKHAAASGAELLQWTADLGEAAPVAQRLGEWLATRAPDALASATLINNAGVISELTPLRDSQVDDLARLHARWPELGFLAEALREAWPVLMPGFHRLEFAAGRVVLTLLLGDAEASPLQVDLRVGMEVVEGRREEFGLHRHGATNEVVDARGPQRVSDLRLE